MIFLIDNNTVGWEIRHDAQGQVYFFDNYTKKASFADPREPKLKHSG